MSESWF